MYRHSILPRNVLRGIIPTYTGFEDIPPTDLGNATDGDVATGTGEAKKTLGAAGLGGTFVFTLPRTMGVLVSAVVGLHSTAGSISVYAYSDIFGGWTPAMASSTSTTEVLSSTMTKFIYGNAIILRLSIAVPCDAYIKLYEVVAHEVSI